MTFNDCIPPNISSFGPQMEHPDVAEVAVVGFPHEVKGEGVFAFMILKDHTHESIEEIKNDLRKLVRSKIAGYAIPETFLVSICFFFHYERITNLFQTQEGK